MGKRRWTRRLLWLIGGVAVLALALAGVVLGGAAPAEWGASAVLHPFRRPVTLRPDTPFETVAFDSEGARMVGWLFRPASPPAPRGTVVYLHGIGDNRQSGLGIAKRLLPRGYAVLAVDARAHGASGGDSCSYGVRERRDVSRALDAIGAERAVLLGHSLGAAVALQAAAVDSRVVGVVAASSFCDLRTVVEERARWFFLPPAYVEAALARAGELGRFAPDEASPVRLAPQVRVPVLLLHGAADAKTPPSHSRRIDAALGGPHRLVLLQGVGHDEILGREEAWREIDRFLDEVEANASRPGGVS